MVRDSKIVHRSQPVGKTKLFFFTTGDGYMIDYEGI